MKIDFLNLNTAEASSGQDDIDSFRKNPTNIVVADIFIPDEQRVGTIEDCQKEFSGTKIVAINYPTVGGLRGLFLIHLPTSVAKKMLVNSVILMRKSENPNC